MMEAVKNDEQVKMGIQRRIHSGIKLSSSVHSGSDELEPHSRQNRQYGALCSILREMDKTMSAVKTFKLKCNKGRTEFSVSPVREKNKIELKH